MVTKPAPLLSCVATPFSPGLEPFAPNERVAWFGYDNTSSSAVTLPAGGPLNYFDPPAADRGQPSFFPATKEKYAVAVRYSVPELAWWLQGVKKTAREVNCPSYTPVTIASDLPIVVYTGASPAVLDAAQTLSTHLERITGHQHPVVQGPRPEGLSVGKAGDFIGWEWPYTANIFVPESPYGRQDYVVATHGGSRISLAGATDGAVRHAVWEFLHQLGYRQYFPGSTWEIVPQRPVIQDLLLTIQRRPAFLHRGWRAEGAYTWTVTANPAPRNDPEMGALMDQQMDEWMERNHLEDELDWTPGHAYSAIRSDWAERCGAAFPLGLRPPPPSSKLCIPGQDAFNGQTITTDDVVSDYAARRFGTCDPVTNPPLCGQDCADPCPNCDPLREFVSVEASDGGGWEGCADESLSISDRVAHLANLVADQHPNKVVGIRSYSFHAAAPTFDLRPNVLTEFTLNGSELFGRIAAWKAKGAKLLGFRDTPARVLLDIQVPDDAGETFPPAAIVPGSGYRATRPREFAETLKRLHQEGVRFYEAAEVRDSWAPLGLAYWLGARTLLLGSDVDVDAEIDDFFNHAFGPAEPAMRRFFDVLENVRFGHQTPAQLYSALGDARTLAAGHPAILERILALSVYVRHVELYSAFVCSAGGGPALENLVRFDYATRTSRMVDSLRVYTHLAAPEDIPQGALPVCPAAGCTGNCCTHPATSACCQSPATGAPNPWKQDPYPDMNAILTQGVPTPAEAAEFAWIEDPATYRYLREELEDLTPANVPPIPLTEIPADQIPTGPVHHRDASRWYTWAQNGQVAFDFNVVTAGAMPLEVLGRSASSAPWTPVSPLATYPQGLHPLLFNTPHSLHRIAVPLNDDYVIDYASGARFVNTAGFGDNEIGTNLRFTRFFYVPQGTTRIGLWLDAGTDGIIKARGAALPHRDIFLPDLACSDYLQFDVDANEGEDGQAWRLVSVPSGRKPVLLGVPPQLARWHTEFLLPASVVAADGLAP